MFVGGRFKPFGRNVVPAAPAPLSSVVFQEVVIPEFGSHPVVEKTSAPASTLQPDVCPTCGRSCPCPITPAKSSE